METTKVSSNGVPPASEFLYSSKTGESMCEESWGDVMHQFCEDTSIHGLKQVSEDQPFLLRRLIWFLLVLGGTAAFVLQLRDSIVHYRESPVAVDIKINYNTTMYFPAVTICNQNTFRTTKAAEMGWYELLTDLYSQEGVNLAHYNATHIPLDTFYQKASHRKEDFIVSCEWATGSCDPVDFVTRMTDYGMCFTFNSCQNSPIKYVTQTGTKGGLRLHLNIEQYEYMRGPNNGAGIRVLIHNPYDVPHVKDLGAAVMPGSHAYMGVQITEVHDLEPPHGKCRSDKKVDLHDVYTMDNCIDDCMTRNITQNCHCRDIYMKGDDPICNLSSFQSCLKPKLDSFNVAESCDCEIPCTRKLYEPIISYGATSHFDMDKMLKGEYIKNVGRSFVKARETTQRVDNRIAAEDRNLIFEFWNATNTLDMKLDDIVNSLNVGLSRTNKYVDYELKGRVSFHKKKGVDKVHYIMKHDFDRGWEIIEERTLPFVTAEFFGTMNTYEVVVEKLMNSSGKCPESIWLVAEADLMSKRRLALRAKDNITEAHIAYDTGVPLLTYKASRDRRYDMSWVCLELLQSSTHAKQQEYYDYVMENIDSYVASIDKLLAIGYNLVQNQTFDRAEYAAASGEFFKYAKAYNYRLFVFKDRVIVPPLKESESRVEQFVADNETLYKLISEDMSTLIRQIGESVTEVSASWGIIRNFSKSSMDFLSDPTQEKTPLAAYMSSEEMKTAINDLVGFFGNIQARAINLYDQWHKIADAITWIWRVMLTDPCTQNFYKMVHDDAMAMMNTTTYDEREFYIRHFASLLDLKWYQTRRNSDTDLVKMLNAYFITMNISEKEAEIHQLVDEWAEATDITAILGDADKRFVKSLLALQESMSEFLEGNKVDVAFYRENFMRLDVFMRELSYEEIIQDEAYSFTQLMCDMGGSVGLFLGASFLSLFEIIDTVCHHFCRKYIKKEKLYAVTT